LEEEVFCGPSCVFTNVMNPRAAIERKHEFKPTLVRRGATIGANATVLCGVTIGRWALVGAGAFVRQDVSDFSLMVGVPARRIGWVSIYGDTLPSLLVGEIYTCPRDGSQYHLARANFLELITPEPPIRK
ncbi:MAG: acyltransferase, partial [Candidatus Sumerlaeota bacterium]